MTQTVKKPTDTPPPGAEPAVDTPPVDDAPQRKGLGETIRDAVNSALDLRIGKPKEEPVIDAAPEVKDDPPKDPPKGKGDDTSKLEQVVRKVLDEKDHERQHRDLSTRGAAVAAAVQDVIAPPKMGPFARWLNGK